MENSSDDNMSYERNLRFLTNVKKRYKPNNAKIENYYPWIDIITDTTITILIDMVLYLSERVKILEQEKEHFYEK